MDYTANSNQIKNINNQIVMEYVRNGRIASCSCILGTFRLS